MPLSERAKQFLPFAAVKGLTEALEKKEKALQFLEKIELSEDRSDELNQKISQLNKGEIISITYYDHGEYIQITGTFLGIDKVYKSILLDTIEIAFDDIFLID
ncbi:MAG: hypothetical protein BGO41_00250 [Clostridiales bacterium 38-18]|nr:MAG: hypothetical protein BGO41_00250 [Clostridiales bacterium 38-18]